VKDFSVTANRQRSSFRHAIRITPGHVDFLAELRGFEPMAIVDAVRSTAIRIFASQGAKGSAL
jgi:hypothetical protein